MVLKSRNNVCPPYVVAPIVWDMGVKVSFKFSIVNLHSNEFPAAD
jgi:hypothetical protein